MYNLYNLSISHFTPWSLDLIICLPFQLYREHTVLQSFRRIKLIIHIAISLITRYMYSLTESSETYHSPCLVPPFSCRPLIMLIVLTPDD